MKTEQRINYIALNKLMLETNFGYLLQISRKIMRLRKETDATTENMLEDITQKIEDKSLYPLVFFSFMC